MRIAVLNRKPGDHFGGDNIQVENYIFALRKLGHQVDFFWELCPPIHGYDYAIYHHIGFGFTRAQYEANKNLSVPYTVVSVFYPGVYPDSRRDIAMLIGRNAKKLVCFSREEAEEMAKELELDVEKIVIVPNGVDKSIFKKDGEKATMQDFVMGAGRCDPVKGHELLIEACKELNLPVVIAASDWDKEYRNKLKSLWNKAVVLDHMNQTELAKWYRSSRVFALTSPSERDNLCVKEAAASGSSVINSIHNRGKESLSAPAVEPKNKEELKKAILEAYHNPKDYSDEVKDWIDLVPLVI
jgi:glycosyltransferase involved in cell wall biosynthesis